MREIESVLKALENIGDSVVGVEFNWSNTCVEAA